MKRRVFWSRLVSFGVIWCLFASFAIADKDRKPEPEAAVQEVSQTVKVTDNSSHQQSQSVQVTDDSTHTTTQTVNEGDRFITVNTLPAEVEVSLVGGESPVEVTTGAQTVNFGGTKITQAAQTAIAGYGNTTASCFRTYGLGGSSTGTSWSVGWPVKDKDCELGEDAAQAFLMGNPLAAWRMYCNQSSVKGVYGARRFNRTSHEEAATACLLEAGIAEMVAEANEYRDEFGDQFATLEQMIARQAAVIAAYEGRLVDLESVPVPEPAPAGVTAKKVRQIVAEEQSLYVTVAVAEPAAVLVCPPSTWPEGISAMFCDGVAYLNPSRIVPAVQALKPQRF